MRRTIIYLITFLFLIAAFSCSTGPTDDVVTLRMASTTSTQNSGLTDYLFPFFEKASEGKIRIELIAVGTGKALKLGERGDVDLVFVHAPELEEAFVKQGYGVNRHAVMHNDFVILGPPADPASIKGKSPAPAAFRRVAEQKGLFISRGDNSGTHIKELSIWKKAGIDPEGEEWYLKTGSGMAATLRVADEKQAYTLSDRGTYLNYRSRIELAILHQSDPVLHNPYHIMAVNPERFPHVHFNEAMRFIEWITSSQGQGLIASYKKQGDQLFFPDAGK